MSIVSTTITDATLDPDRMMLEGVDTSKGPTYSISEVAKFFFARSTHWIRWLEKEKRMMLDGKPVGTRRNDKDVRIYFLSDVEQIAHGLAQSGSISGTQLRETLQLVRISAEMNGYL